MATYLKHTVMYGDSLQNIAQDRLNSAERWVEIAILNDLVYPFIVDTREEVVAGVKTIGDTILVPVEGDQIDIIPKNEIEGIYDKALGQDLSIFDEDVITLSNEEIGEFSSDAYGDVGVVNGLKNLRQAYLIRLSTPLGTLLHHPNYGSTLIELIGAKSTGDTLHKVKIEVERAIRSDARTEDITFVRSDLIGDTINLDIRVKPIGFEVAFIMSLTLREGGLIEWA